MPCETECSSPPSAGEKSGPSRRPPGSSRRLSDAGVAVVWRGCGRGVAWWHGGLVPPAGRKLKAEEHCKRKNNSTTRNNTEPFQFAFLTTISLFVVSIFSITKSPHTNKHTRHHGRLSRPVTRRRKKGSRSSQSLKLLFFAESTFDAILLFVL